jgi:uncharacterized protein YecE (DUF72 family)
VIKNYFLGCPVWAHKGWVGKFFDGKAKSRDYLQQYSEVFNTVEGNNTFYSLPYQDAVLTWKDIVPEDFRFCFKFPYSVTHARQLNNVSGLMEQFFSVLKPLEKQIGLFFLQLPPYFTPNHIERLREFLSELPQHYSYTVEVRHNGFYNGSSADAELNQLLEEAAASRAIFDTKVLHQIQSEDKTIIESQNKKPAMPEYFTAVGKNPLIRFVGHNDVEPNLFRVEKIADVVANWIKEGKTPYVFMHTPDYNNEPELCDAFHQFLVKKLPEMDLGFLPKSAGQRENALPEQLSLF